MELRTYQAVTEVIKIPCTGGWITGNVDNARCSKFEQEFYKLQVHAGAIRICRIFHVSTLEIQRRCTRYLFGDLLTRKKGTEKSSLTGI